MGTGEMSGALASRSNYSSGMEQLSNLFDNLVPLIEKLWRRIGG
jgi:hypothetical protein